MIIRIAVIDRDENYLNHLCEYFSKNYTNQIQLALFSDIQKFMEKQNYLRLDLLLVSNEFLTYMNDITDIQKVVFMDSNDLQEIMGLPAIGKYQSVEKIYRDILEVYANTTKNAFVKKDVDNVRTVCFTHAAGGVGATTAALGYALQKANEGHRVFYLDLNMNSNLGNYLSSPGQTSMSNVLIAVKNGKNVDALLEAYIRKDESGICYYVPVDNMFDMRDMTEQDVENILKALARMKQFDVIVCDVVNDYSERFLAVVEHSSQVVVVTDGSVGANVKTKKMLDSMYEFYYGNEVKLRSMRDNWGLFYNRFAGGMIIDEKDSKFENLGGVNYMSDTTGKALLEKVGSRMNFG